MASRIGCVSYLNSRPLVWGLDDDPQVQVIYDVPANLPRLLEQDRCDVALLPVIDFQRSPDLVIAPASCIGADGPVYTVGLFSRVPIGSIRKLCLDTDSHTSVALARIVLKYVYQVEPEIVAEPGLADARLLIGDKVVSAVPPDHPHQLDLADAWKRWTGLPFVFAVWMSRRGRDLGQLPSRLNLAMRQGLTHVDKIARDEAADHGWPAEVARRYLRDLLKFPIDLSAGSAQRRAMERFYSHAAEMGLIGQPRAIELYSL